jgi:hypothetical protein
MARQSLITKYREYVPGGDQKLGAYPAIGEHAFDIPALGWKELDHLYLHDGTYKKFPGWTAFGNMASSNPIIYGFDFKKFDNSRHLVTASKTNIYSINRSTGAATSIAGSFTGTNAQRWQSTILNDKLYITNGVDPIQEYQGNNIITALTGDASLPKSKYIITSAGHLVCGYTLEGATTYPRRVRWSKVGDPNTWIPNAATNDAGFIDLPDDIGELRNIANLGVNSFVAYGSSAIYILTFVGLPAIWLVQRQVTMQGLYMPYSLVAFNDRHFFLDTDDFKMFAGSIETQRLGIDRQASYFFADFKSSDFSNIYGFAHPILPLVGWVYVQREQTNFETGKAVFYNYANNTWSSRSSFPHWMICRFWDTVQQPDAEVLIGGSTNPPAV